MHGDWPNRRLNLIEQHRNQTNSNPLQRRGPAENARLCQDSSEQPGILVVDDNRMVRGLLQNVLLRHGFAVWSAADWREAAKIYRQARHQIHLVLLDVCLDNLDGPQTALALRVINPRVRFCFMSGGNGPYTVQDLLAFGAAQTFEKPFRLADFVRTLRELVGLSCLGNWSCYAPGQN